MKKHDKYDFLVLERSDIRAVYRARNTPPNRNASGYGNKIPMPYFIQTTDGFLRRVYSICHANTATAWIHYQGKEPTAESAILDYCIECGVSAEELPFIGTK